MFTGDLEIQSMRTDMILLKDNLAQYETCACLMRNTLLSECVLLLLLITLICGYLSDYYKILIHNVCVTNQTCLSNLSLLLKSKLFLSYFNLQKYIQIIYTALLSVLHHRRHVFHPKRKISYYKRDIRSHSIGIASKDIILLGCLAKF